MNEDPKGIDEFDRLITSDLERRIMDSGPLFYNDVGIDRVTRASTTALEATAEKEGKSVADVLESIMAAALGIAVPRSAPVFDLPMVDLVVPDLADERRRLRLETMFATEVRREPQMIVRLYDFDRPSRSFHDEFWDTLKFFSMLQPIRQRRKKARRRFKVQAVKRRNGWKRHLRKAKR